MGDLKIKKIRTFNIVMGSLHLLRAIVMKKFDKLRADGINSSAFLIFFYRYLR